MSEIEVVYTTTWCSDCRRTKKFLEDNGIVCKTIDINKDEEATEIVRKLNDGKRRVPTIVFTDGTVLSVPSNEELSRKLEVDIINGKDFHEILIIGSGITGLNCALLLANSGIDTAIVEKDAIGGQLCFFRKVDNYPGFPEGIDGYDLAKRLNIQGNTAGVEFIGSSEIVQIQKSGDTFRARTSYGRTIGAKIIVVASGRRSQRLNIPGEEQTVGHQVHYCAACDGPFYKDKELVVIGSGDKAFKEALFLSKYASKITILGRHENWKASHEEQIAVSRNDKINLVANKEVVEFIIKDEEKPFGLKIIDSTTKKKITLNPDGVFVFIGVEPNADAVLDMVDFTHDGFIKTNDKMMTKTEGLFAAGDCRACCTDHPTSAIREGAAVVQNILFHSKKLGT